jgi:RNA polymerase sigma factor (sigma-70 family)
MIRDEETARRMAEIYNNYRHQAWFEAYDYLKNELEAEDAVQEVFTKLIRNADTVTKLPEDKLGAYILKATKNLCLDYQRRDENAEVTLYGVRNTYEMNEAGGITPERIVLGKEKLEAVLRCFGKLPEAHQVLMRCRVMEDYSSEELAERLNIKTNTVDARVSRARKKLKELWNKEGNWNG